MFKKKITLVSILLAFIFIVSAFATGCNNQSSQQPNDDNSQKVYTLLADDISILVGYEYTPNLTLRLNGEVISSTITLSSADTEFVSINNGKLKAEKIGQSVITAVASIDNEQMATTTFKCEVKENKSIHPLKSSFLLYVSNNVKGVAFETYTDLNALVYENGAIIDDAKIDWTVGNEEIATIGQDGRLQAVALGETYVVGSYNLSNGQTLKTIKLPVKVEIPVLELKEDLIIDKENENQAFDAQSILGKTEIGTISNLTNGKEYAVNENQVKTSLFKSGEYTCVFYDKDKTVGVKVSVVSADFVVYDNQDLLHITSLTDGYIALANDLSNIDYSNTYNKSFKGVFNGLGHTISNIRFKTSTGLFYNTNGATIKNVAIKNATLEKASSGVFLYRNAGGETIVDNTYVTVKLSPGQWDAGGAFAFVFGGKVVYSNSIIYSEGFTSGGNGMVLGRAYAQIVLDNCFAIGNGPICGTGSNQYNRNYEAVNRTAGVRYVSDEELLIAYNKGKTNYSGFNKYWNLSTGIPVM